MALDELILSDYGTVPAMIGTFLLKHKASTLPQIQAVTKLCSEDLIDGLSLLIQRGIVKIFLFEKAYRYIIEKSMIKRRMYFPLYLNYIVQNHSSKHAKIFLTVMINGTYKEVLDPSNTIFDDLITIGLLRVEKPPQTHRKPAAGFVLKALSKCEVINRDSIISNLDSTKVLVSDKGTLLNEKENINEYLKLLVEWMQAELTF